MMKSTAPTPETDHHRRARRRIGVGMALVLAASAWAGLKWPTYSFVAWMPPVAVTIPATPLLDAAVRVGAAHLPAPEDVLSDRNGGVLASCVDGLIRRIDRDGAVSPWVTTGGRPLGMTWAANGQDLLVADARRGLLRIDPSGQIRVLLREFEGKALRFIDDVTVAPDGVAYVSDASTRCGPHDDLRLEMASHDPTGRVFAVRPNGQVERFAAGFYFANGVAVTPDGAHLLVSETAAYRVQRCALKGSQRGKCSVWMNKLPGMPDNLRMSPRGTVWVALVAPRRHLLDAYIHPYPAAKWAMAFLPGWLLPKPELKGQVLEVENPDRAQGQALRLLQAPGGEHGMTTSAREIDGILWLGHIDKRQGGVLRVPLKGATPESPSHP